jgi:hypothetical protein
MDISKQIYLPNLLAGLTYDIDTYAVFPYTIQEIRQIQTSSGSVDVAMKIAGTNVTWNSSPSANTSPADFSATGNNTVSVGQRVQLVFSSNSGATNINFTLAAARADSNGYVNKFRNGTMDIWQRTTSLTSITTAGAYMPDGWIIVPTGASCTAAQSTANGRTGRLSTYSLLLTGATGVTDILFKQRIESYIAQPLEGQQVTVQAEVYNNTGGSITPTLTVKHANAADDWSASTTDVNAESLQSCANGAWTQVAYTFAASSSSGNGLEITVDLGNNFSTTGKSAQVTELDIRVTPGVATGTNSAPPTPEMRPCQAELAFCQRYFCKTFPQGTAPATSTGQDSPINVVGQVTGQLCIGNWDFPVTMRASPTITTYSPNANNSNWSTNGNTPVASVARIADNGIGIYALTNITPGNGYDIHATASAEL